MNVIIANIGEELLNGEVLNTDFQLLSSAVFRCGGNITKQVCLPDDPDVIKKEIKKYICDSDIIITTGGLGPTSDDLTKKTVAEIFNRNLVKNTKIYNTLKERYRFSSPPVTEASIREQSLLPEKAKVIFNTVGSAPGIFIEEGNKKVLMLPGPPCELEPMVKDGLRLLGFKEDGAFSEGRVNYICVSGMSESVVDSIMAEILKEKGNFSYGLRAKTGEVIIRLKTGGGEAAAALLEEIKKNFGSNMYSEKDERVENMIGELLTKHQKTVAVAESCTGGMLSEIITGISGSSKYFLGGYVTYCNNLKILDLGVSKDVLVSKGAVSSQCALQMARGCRRRATSDVAVSITGIAGPSGGTSDKPVGLVYVALDDGFVSRTEEFRFVGQRDQVRRKACYAALDLLRKYLIAE
ncbi:MAG: CinA family nicotinamide mononucleotide deamidase-related protein [bacterium]|nr:CinA family nicotinamide mononucleotide deamidase-related protein [bacterium]